MRERIAVVDEDGVQAGHPRPTADRRNDGRLACDGGVLFDLALEQRADDRFMDKAVTCLAKDREALLAFYDFSAEHWKTRPMAPTVSVS